VESARTVQSIGSQLWARVWNGLPPFDRSAEPILRYLVGNGFIDQDGEMLFIGPAAEAKFGRRHFMGMTAAFTARPSSPSSPAETRSAPTRCCLPSTSTARA
jgi:hypothetical protein